MSTLKKGDKAPNFSSKDENGNSVKLSDYKGKKLVLYFYPKDDTPGCTAEACNLRDNYVALQKAGYAVLGVSSDDEKKHTQFKAKYDLPFGLLADTDKSVHEAYGTWLEKSMYGRKYMGTARVTFIINEKGILEDVIEKVDTKNHTDQILTDGAVAPKAKTPAKKVVAKKASKAPARKAVAKKKVVKK
jgi:peroxiredoxin Q/BCP